MLAGEKRLRLRRLIESRLMTLDIGQHRQHLFYVNTRISHYTRKHIRTERERGTHEVVRGRVLRETDELG